MSKKKIYLSPSDQTANAYAYGNTTEAVQCRRITDVLEKALKRCGFDVLNNKTSSMYDRVRESNNWGADLHMPVHTNAFNKKVGGTRIFYYNSTGDGCKCAKKVFNRLAPVTPGTSDSMKVDDTLYEVYHTTASCVYVECEFHDVKEYAKWIINNVDVIAEAICRGICDYFSVEYKAPGTTSTLPQTGKKLYHVQVGAFTVKSNAEKLCNELKSKGFKDAYIKEESK